MHRPHHRNPFVPRTQVAFSEDSRSKCIGLTIETRPDFCHSPHLTQMLSYGCTRIEMGVQSVYEDVARDTNRGHTVGAVKTTFRLAKEAGFKVVAHLMPDLPNVGWERDVESFREFFENPAFRCVSVVFGCFQRRRVHPPVVREPSVPVRFGRFERFRRPVSQWPRFANRAA